MIAIDTRDLKRAYSELAMIPDAAPKAITAAINKGVARANTLIKRNIVQIYNIIQKDVAMSLRVVKARPTNSTQFWLSHTGTNYLAGGVFSSGHRVAWSKFNMKPTKPPKQLGVKVKNRKKISIQILKKGRRVTLNHPFMARMKSGHIGIFTRGDSSKLQRVEMPDPDEPGKNIFKTTDLPIHQKQSISIPEMMTSHEAFSKIQKEVFELTQEKLTEQINLFLSGKRK